MKQQTFIKAYIDSYNDITLIIEKKGKYKAKQFYLYDAEDLVEELKISYNVQEHTNMIKIGLKVTSKLNLHHSYYIFDDLGNMIPVYSGSVVRTTEFESEFYYDGPLGFEYDKNCTIFRVWSPVAKDIYVKLIYPNGNIDKRELEYQRHGVWAVEIEGDLENTKYVYYVRVFDEYKRVNDPYGISSCANGDYNYVIDINKLRKMKYEKPFFSGYYTDAVIYEASVRDLTVGLDNNLKGTFAGLIDEAPDKGLNYMADLGITHFQIMPIYDFGGVDDIDKDKEYNWGYNPEQYFVPCGWYSQNPNDPYSRLNEFLELVDEAHKRGLRVVMDVVFNHVYKKELFPFEILVPGYFYRVDSYGNYTNVSGCGNDIASEKRMCTRFIVDNLVYWAKYFNISGFRFDLMGLLDIDTMNMIYKKLREIDPKIIVYGEGWNMPNTIPDAFRPHSFNHYKMPEYAFFNDKYRDFFKGSQWDGSLGFVFGKGNNYDTYHLITGSSLDKYKFENPSQSVNYVECHDNYTLFDFATKRLKLSEQKAKKGARLALEIIAISLGIPFIHAGEEFYRTKQGVENSYNSSDKFNLFDYKRRDENIEDINSLKDLLKIRKKYPEFRMTNTRDIEKRVHLSKQYTDSNMLTYVLDGDTYKLCVVIKNNDDTKSIDLKDYSLIFDGHKSCLIKKDVYELKEEGVYIFKEEINKI